MLTIILLCLMGFIAALIDSIAGGGGLISVPALMMTGLPTHVVLGTNKFSSSTASLTSSIKFAKSGKVDFKLLKYLIPFTFVGSATGVYVLQFIPADFLKSVVLVLVLIIGVYSLKSKTLGMQDNSTDIISRKTLGLGMFLAFTLGFYDGFFGPGTGSFLIFGLIKIFKFDFTKASGNAKMLNFTSNISALILFAIQGNINYIYGIPVAIFMILGARVGTNLALEKGPKFIKPIFAIMSFAVFVKLIYPYIVSLF
ncbi:MAG: TSUP family transporter [Clostridium sp.]